MLKWLIIMVQISEMITAAYAGTCPDGKQARGRQQEGYFAASFGKNCEEMACPDGEQCQQVNKYFAKCCKNAESTS